MKCLEFPQTPFDECNNEIYRPWDNKEEDNVDD